MIKVSILIPSVHTRYNTFRPKIEEELYRQYNALSIFDQSRVEIILLSDTKSITLGDKRNIMVDMAQGEYIVFVDDDDRISPDYIPSLLDATKSDADVITFYASVTLNNSTPIICKYSKDYKQDNNIRRGQEIIEFHRIPNHICCVKKEISLKVSFPALAYAEDQGYSKLLIRHLKTEHNIHRVLYHYDYNENTTETQEHLAPISRRRKQPSIVDIVILSKATTAQMKAMTQKAIDSAIAGANSLPVNVVVIEQIPHIQYSNAQTVFHNAKFEYNNFMNLGARQGQSEWIMFSNNDVIFQSGWLHELLIVNHPVMSSKCPVDYRQKDITHNTTGDINGKHFSGWNFTMKRSVWEEIGGLDGDFTGWYADDSVIEQVKAIGILPMMVPTSIVRHLGSVTLKSLNPKEMSDLCWSQLELFNKKYNKQKFVDNPNYLAWKQKNKLQ